MQRSLRRSLSPGEPNGLCNQFIYYLFGKQCGADLKKKITSRQSVHSRAAAPPAWLPAETSLFQPQENKRFRAHHRRGCQPSGKKECRDFTCVHHLSSPPRWSLRGRRMSLVAPSRSVPLLARCFAGCFAGCFGCECWNRGPSPPALALSSPSRGWPGRAAAGAARHPDTCSVFIAYLFDQ